jgi:outer membrane protein TolC
MVAQMKQTALVCRSLMLVSLACAWGCSIGQGPPPIVADADLAYFRTAATAIEYPDVAEPACGDVLATAPPMTLEQAGPVEYWPLTLQEAVRIGLSNSKILRDLGGLVVASPQNVQSVQSPMIVETDPRFGVEAALSAFDASLEARTFFEKHDHPLNNFLFSGGRAFQQDLAAAQVELSKRAATGSEFSLRHGIDYDFNNTPGNPFVSYWQNNVTAEIRHPLLQGSGVEFNRIAGPDSVPGVYAGVQVARINTDISLADFEMGVRDLVADIETQYWELYFAYRDLDAKLAARNRALETWRRIRALYETGRLGGEAEKEAQARAQYFRFEEDVQNALTGHQFQKSRTIAFAFRGNNGIQANERQLRLLMGVPVSDGRLIKPVEEPLQARVLFEWDQILTQAIAGREELRRQRWQVKRRELELVAARNYLLPRVDAFGRYAWVGFGRDLLNSTRQSDRFDNAYQTLTSGDFQEWQMGVEMQMPVGMRQGHVAVRNAELQLARDHALLEAQERDVAHDLASALAEMQRAYAVAQTNYNRRVASAQQLAALEAIYEDADENQKTRLLDLILNAQSDLASAESGYYRAVTEHSLAVTQVHFQKGTLLEYNEVCLAEGAWPGQAYRDAAARARLRVPPHQIQDYLLATPRPVSRGPRTYADELRPLPPIAP